MSTQLILEDNNRLREDDKGEMPPLPFLIRGMAKLVSYLFHPLFIPVYLSGFLVYTQSWLFAGLSSWDRQMVIVRFFVMYTFFPLVTVMLAKGLGFLKSIYLKSQRDRIIPYVACGVYYFWMWYVLHNQPEFPDSIVKLTLAIFIASSLGLIVNIYMKISMHAMAMGVMLVFMLLLAFLQPVNSVMYLSVSFLVAGAVCTARFIVSDHTPAEIYGGLVLGAVSQLLANWLG